MALGVSPAVMFKDRAINNNTTKAANALLFQEAVGIGQIQTGETPALPVKTIFMHPGCAEGAALPIFSHDRSDAWIKRLNIFTLGAKRQAILSFRPAVAGW
jgi:hypothetical protein